MILAVVEPGELSLQALALARELGAVEAVLFEGEAESLPVSRAHAVVVEG